MIANTWLNSLERIFHLLFIWIYLRSKILLWLRFVITVYWWSVIMVTRYNVIISRWSNQFWVTMNVFSTSFNNKSKACVCVDAKCLFMCYFTRQARKKYHLSRLQRPPCFNMSENSGKHYFILQGRLVSWKLTR